MLRLAGGVQDNPEAGPFGARTHGAPGFHQSRPVAQSERLLRALPFDHDSAP
jgi:hypothetical protein